MKTKLILSIFILSVVTINAFAQGKTIKASIKVYGNCAMCKERIETALLDSKGIKQAIWDTKTKELQVVYVSSKITEKDVHQIVASVGHDTDKVKATDETYAELPFCCLYRDHDHSGVKDGGRHH
jgi:mercuric ion binding protein